MSTDPIDLTLLGERLVGVHRTYGESIDLPNLERSEFAMLLGVCAAAYETYELGERPPRLISWLCYTRRPGSV